MEFHVSKNARNRYQFDLSIYNSRGNVIFANFYAARRFAEQINKTRDLVRFPEQAVQPGKINALGLIDEIGHAIIKQYLASVNQNVFVEALDWLEKSVGSRELDNVLQYFTNEFPPLSVYQGKETVEEYLDGSTDGVSNREISLEELLALWIANRNPAFSPFLELFDDSSLQASTAYRSMTEGLLLFFEEQPPFGAGGMSLIDMLEAPARAHPHSLEGQLAFLLEKWGHLIGDYVVRILSSLDLIQEEQKAGFIGPGPSPVPQFSGTESEPERFSPDHDWMPEIVIIAKNAFVWLHQLSKDFSEDIVHLDQVPDAELEKLSRWGITGLWLIGLWQRSPASKRIKNLMGNEAAEASAYSLFSYEISSELGGEAAFQDLKRRAWNYGIRLASDMVPNHMGIDSPWIINHPDWFLSLDHSPYPAYSFNGPDLSKDPGVGIFIEDHYYNQTDAAVVFKRHDRGTGNDRFIYHGNDGTSTPWNDTAQINFLNAEAREAIIQTILHVARNFPIIRFDAAMTLAKRHYQRLWFPEPGSGGAIPSRAGLGLTKSKFNELMPMEFWREVVDRVAAEVPDTLLLAEAFWLMEGYFVRTLGMHRVYNSAFMNMLRDEENANYRSVVKNTIQFDPEILKRFVNFMNNPDERTAVDQFGKGDKYFGICILMSTMPGLPMFGHGQIEGLTEKYGMEFRKPAWEEIADPALISRHEREVFPLLYKRRLFADVANFRLYDFIDQNGHVNEDVFAYTNREASDRALIVYHNRYAETKGTIKMSAPYAVGEPQGSGKTLHQSSLLEGLNLSGSPKNYCIFKDQISGIEYLLSSQILAEKGLELQLAAYKTYVFTDIKEVYDESGQYQALDQYLNGLGVPSVEEARRELLLQPIHQPLRELLNPVFYEWLLDQDVATEIESEWTTIEDEINEKINRLNNAVLEYVGVEGKSAHFAENALRYIKKLLDRHSFIPFAGDRPAAGDPIAEDKAQTFKPDLYLAISWSIIAPLGGITSDRDIPELSRALIDEWMLGKLVNNLNSSLDLADNEKISRMLLLKALVLNQDWSEEIQRDGFSAESLFRSILENSDSSQFIGVNRYQDVLWINQERLESYLKWLSVIHQIKSGKGDEKTDEFAAAQLELLRIAAENSGYNVELMLAELQQYNDPEMNETYDRIENSPLAGEE